MLVNETFRRLVTQKRLQKEGVCVGGLVSQLISGRVKDERRRRRRHRSATGF